MARGCLVGQRCCLLALALLALITYVSAGKDEWVPNVVGTKYQAAYHYIICDADYVIRPSTTEEVAKSVKYFHAVAESTRKTLKIRSSRPKFHTTTNFACPQQNLSLVEKEVGPDYLTVGIMHDGMRDTLGVDAKKYQLKVQAGMHLTDLFAAADKYEMSVISGSLPAYAGLTIGGIIAGGAHGTGDNTFSNPCDTIIDITWVDGEGEIHVTPRGTEEGLAICSGMGIIGIITEVTFQLTPPTNTKLITRYLSDDKTLVDDIELMLKVSPHILVFWRPDMKVYSAYMLKAVSTSVPATTDRMNLLPSYKGFTSMANLFAAVQDDIFDNRFDLSGIQRSFMCPTVGFNAAAHTWAAKTDGTQVLYTVGRTNAMQASECDDHCAWNGPEYNGTAEDVHYAIEFSQFRDWVDDLKAVVTKDLWETPYDKNRCLGPGYIWLRFGRNTTDYLTMSYNMTRPVYVQSTWLRSRSSSYPMRFNFVQEMLEQFTLCKYRGRPHWGKNWPRTFTHPKCPVKSLYPEFDKVLKMQKKYDPKKIYEPNLFTKIVQDKPYTFYPRCAQFKDCFCEEDIHCAKDYACMPSIALPEFKVCKPDWRLAGKPKPTKELPGNIVERFTRALPRFPAFEDFP